MKVFAITILIALSIYGCFSRLPLIRPTPDQSGNVNLYIPRGGAVVKPVSPMNTSITMTMIIAGQACDLNDPLIFMYDNDISPGSGLVIANFPSNSFYIHGCCAGSIGSFTLNVYQTWTLQTYWNGNKFVDNVPASCCD